MNALTHSPCAWSTCRKALCAAALAVWAGSAFADEVAMDSTRRQARGERLVRAEIPAIHSHKATAWIAPQLPLSWSGIDQPAAWYTDETYLAAMSSFDSRSLFRTRKEMLYQDTLRLLLTKRQVRVWLRDNLHLQCEVKRWHTVDDGRELGVKLGVYYRFD